MLDKFHCTNLFPFFFNFFNHTVSKCKLTRAAIMISGPRTILPNFAPHRMDTTTKKTTLATTTGRRTASIAVISSIVNVTHMWIHHTLHQHALTSADSIADQTRRANLAAFATT